MDYERPDWRLLGDRASLVQAVFDSLKPWTPNIDDVEFLNSGKTSEQGVNLKIPLKRVSFFFGAGSSRFTRHNADWQSSNETLEIRPTPNSPPAPPPLKARPAHPPTPQNSASTPNKPFYHRRIPPGIRHPHPHRHLRIRTKPPHAHRTNPLHPTSLSRLEVSPPPKPSTRCSPKIRPSTASPPHAPAPNAPSTNPSRNYEPPNPSHPNQNQF